MLGPQGVGSPLGSGAIGLGRGDVRRPSQGPGTFRAIRRRPQA
jgi:hypothetical protein